jgi:hypothetical protein
MAADAPAALDAGNHNPPARGPAKYEVLLLALLTPCAGVTPSVVGGLRHLGLVMALSGAYQTWF